MRASTGFGRRCRPLPALPLTALVVPALVALALVAFVGAPGAAAAREGVVRIGVLAPLTGPDAAGEREAVHGVQMAVDAANASGGVAGYTFEVVAGDVKDRSVAAVTEAVQRLLADGDVHLVLTSFASFTNFEIELMAEAGMPYMLAAPSQQTREIIAADPGRYWCCWSFTPSFDAYASGLPLFVEALHAAGEIELANRKLAIVASDNPYSATVAAGVKKAFADSGWTVTVDAQVPFGEIGDWRPILSGVRQDPPAVLVNTDYIPGNAAAFLSQFLEEPTDSLLFLHYAPGLPQFLELAGEEATGILYTLLGTVLDTPGWPRAGELLKRYEGRFGTRPGAYGIALYEMTRAYFDALRRVGDPAAHRAIGEAIGSTRRPVAQGVLAFDPATHLALQGEEHIPLAFFQIQGGRRVLIAPARYATGTFERPPWLSE